MSKGILAIGINKTDSLLLSPIKEADLFGIFSGGQYFVYFAHFIDVKDNEIIIDLAMQGFDLGDNILGQNIIEMLIQYFMHNVEYWSDNFIREPFEITNNLLRQLALMYNQQKLKDLTQDLEKLSKYLKSLDEVQKDQYYIELSKKKNDFFYKQQYMNTLSQEAQLLFKIKTEYEKKKKQHDIKKTSKFDQEANDDNIPDDE